MDPLPWVYYFTFNGPAVHHHVLSLYNQVPIVYYWNFKLFRLLLPNMPTVSQPYTPTHLCVDNMSIMGILTLNDR
jgi:hypothetical protein